MLTRELATAPNNLEAFWMPFTANRHFKAQPAPDRRRRGHALHDAGRAPDHRRHRGPVVLSTPATPARGSSRRSAAGGRARLRAQPSSGATPRRSSWRRAWPRLLPGDLDHAFFTNSGSEVGRHRAQDRAGLPARDRPGHAHPPDRPRARLPRRRLRRHLGRRHGQEPDVLRLPADRRRPPAAHLDLEQQALQPRASPAWGAHLADELERHRGAARRLDHRRGDRRAGGGLDRRLAAAGGLSRAAARDHARSTASC